MNAPVRISSSWPAQQRWAPPDRPRWVCQFGFDNPGHTSDGKFMIRNGPVAADYLVDLHGFMNIDQ